MCPKKIGKAYSIIGKREFIARNIIDLATGWIDISLILEARAGVFDNK